MTTRRAERLLQTVHETGWSASGQRAFVDLYGALLRRSILYHVRRCFGATGLQSLADHLAALESGSDQPRGTGTRGEILDIACDTWQDVLLRACRTEDNLVDQWFSYANEKGATGATVRDFETYLKGAIHNAFWGNLRRRKKDLDSMGTSDGLEEYSDGLSLEEKIPVGDEVCVLWDRLLRCQRPDPEGIEAGLVRLRQEPETVLVWACAALKKRHCEAGRKTALENLMAFMAFFCSQSGAKLSDVHPSGPAELNYEHVAGKQYRWEKDICGWLFRKRIRKDRPMAEIHDLLASSQYAKLIDGTES